MKDKRMVQMNQIIKGWKMVHYLKIYGVALSVFLVVDLIWIGM